MAADVGAFQVRLPDVIETHGDILAVGGEADIRAAGIVVRRLIGPAAGFCHQERAGEKVSEMRAGSLCHFTAFFPKRIVVSAIEGNDHQLLGRSGAGGGCGEGERRKSGQKTQHINLILKTVLPLVRQECGNPLIVPIVSGPCVALETAGLCVYCGGTHS